MIINYNKIDMKVMNGQLPALHVTQLRLQQYFTHSKHHSMQFQSLQFHITFENC